jgi:hypothetical protein
MDYFKDAFDGFNPQKDQDAALKFSLCVLMIDRRTDELLHLVTGKEHFGGVEGEPGWIIERREEGEQVGYETWPNDARFRAYVEPNGYSLAHPEFFADRQTFFKYVRAIVTEYVRHNPDKAEFVTKITESMNL